MPGTWILPGNSSTAEPDWGRANRPGAIHSARQIETGNLARRGRIGSVAHLQMSGQCREPRLSLPRLARLQDG